MFHSWNLGLKIGEKLIPLVKEAPLIDNDQLTREQIIEKFGNIEIKGLVYKIQIGAYKMPYNFKYSHPLEFNVTRFTIGNYSKLKDAEALKAKILAKGGLTDDSFITAIYNGKRVFLEDLVKAGFKL